MIHSFRFRLGTITAAALLVAGVADARQGDAPIGRTGPDAARDAIGTFFGRFWLWPLTSSSGRGH